MKPNKIFFVGLAILGCTTTEHQVYEINSDIEVKEKVGDTKIGLNEDDEIIIQTEKTAGTELQIQQLVNDSLALDLDRELAELNACRKDLADTRLGGSGKISRHPMIDSSTIHPQSEELFGIDENDSQIKYVHRQYYKDLLKSERKREAKLRQLLLVTSEQREICGSKLAQVRVRHGLPAKRIMPKGYFTTEGIWVETRRGEQDLDDALEITSERWNLYREL